MTDEAKRCVESCREWYQAFSNFGKGNERSVKELLTVADLIESLSAQLEQVTRERDAAIRDIDEAAPCFACIRFERNGGDCIGAHVCIDDILQDALGGKYADYYWQWRGVEANQ